MYSSQESNFSQSVQMPRILKVHTILIYSYTTVESIEGYHEDYKLLAETTVRQLGHNCFPFH